MTATKEKTYYINTSKIPGHRKEVEVKESQLTQEHLIILWNKLVMVYSDMPIGLQIQFAQELSKVYKERLKEVLSQPQEEVLTPETNESSTITSENTEQVPGNTEVLKSGDPTDGDGK